MLLTPRQNWSQGRPGGRVLTFLKAVGTAALVKSIDWAKSKIFTQDTTTISPVLLDKVRAACARCDADFFHFIFASPALYYCAQQPGTSPLLRLLNAFPMLIGRQQHKELELLQPIILGFINLAHTQKNHRERAQLSSAVAQLTQKGSEYLQNPGDHQLMQSLWAELAEFGRTQQILGRYLQENSTEIAKCLCATAMDKLKHSGLVTRLQQAETRLHAQHESITGAENTKAIIATWLQVLSSVKQTLANRDQASLQAQKAACINQVTIKNDEITQCREEIKRGTDRSQKVFRR